MNLLLNPTLLPVQYLGSSQRNISFSHGEYFYSLFSEIINSELIKNLDMAVSELMKSSADNPKMVRNIFFKKIFSYLMLTKGFVFMFLMIFLKTIFLPGRLKNLIMYENKIHRNKKTLVIFFIPSSSLNLSA